MNDAPAPETAPAPAPIPEVAARAVEDLMDGIIRTSWLNGGLAMRFRVIKALLAMGERDLAATIGRMDVPTQQNWNDRETVISERTEA